MKGCLSLMRQFSKTGLVRAKTRMDKYRVPMLGQRCDSLQYRASKCKERDGINSKCTACILDQRRGN